MIRFILLALVCSIILISSATAIYPLHIYSNGNVTRNRIINGKAAAPGQFPYQVGLIIEKSGRFTLCGGSLIAVSWILTAAHCVHKASSIKVLLGTIIRTQPKKVITIYSNSILPHFDWNPKYAQHDIALIRIPPVKLSDDIKTIKLPLTQSNYVGQHVTISGWGDTLNGSIVHLQYAQVSVIRNAVCKKRLPTVRRSHICTNSSNGASSCHGDSGGPLVLNNNVLIGVTSFGSGCTKGFPTVFTRVSSYLDWIKTRTGFSY